MFLNGIPVILGETGWEHQKYDTFNENDDGISGPLIFTDERKKWIQRLSKITSSYDMPLIYCDVGTTEDKMGELNRKNLCIKAGDEDFVNQMISNWNLNNKMDQLFEERFNTSNNLLSEPVPLNGWSDSSFNCWIFTTRYK